MTLVTVGSEDVSLVKIESDAFETVEMHEMATVDGMMKMRELKETVIPADGLVRFAPGGKHLMLIGPRQDMTAGQTIDMTLTFESAVKQTVSIKVAAK